MREVLGSGSGQHSCLESSEMAELFLHYMDPAMEGTLADLEWKQAEFRKVKVKDNEKLKVEVAKKIDNLGKRIKCYQLYS